MIYKIAKKEFSKIDKNFFDNKLFRPVKKSVNGINMEIKPKLWNIKSDAMLPFKPIRFLTGLFSSKIKFGSSGE